jgi:hypothetical protein
LWEEKESVDYKTAVKRQRKKEVKEFYDLIIKNGYIHYSPGCYLAREIVECIPPAHRRKNGLPIDRMVEILKSDYPHLGIKDTNDLLRKYLNIKSRRYGK